MPIPLFFLFNYFIFGVPLGKFPCFALPDKISNEFVKIMQYPTEILIGIAFNL